MDRNFFKGKKITVYGLGLHGGGVGTVKFLAKYGAKIIVTDIKTRKDLEPSVEKLKGIKNITYALGQHRIEDFTKVDMVIKNPSVPWSNKHIKLALENKIPVEMDSSIFFKICKNPIIGVTGTKGKTTISTMIHDILKSAGKKPLKVGISQESVLDKLDQLKKDTVVVFELSSWRLSAIGRAKMSPKIAVFKNIMPDHQNYYKSMETYINDKKNIFLHQKPKDWLIINGDDEKLMEISSEAPSQVIKFSYFPKKGGKSIFVDDEKIYLNNGIDIKKIADISDIKLRGKHNIGNLMAAAGAVYAFGIKPDQIKKSLVTLKGVPHRLEFVRELNGVRYYNDTAATIPEAAITAIRSFKRPIVLIAGGNDKNLNFEELGREIANKVREAILLKGTGTDKLLKNVRASLSMGAKNIEVAESMEEAVKRASEISKSGDVVLLSPGAASFGMFENEFDRGIKFRTAVKNLK